MEFGDLASPHLCMLDIDSRGRLLKHHPIQPIHLVQHPVLDKYPAHWAPHLLQPHFLIVSATAGAANLKENAGNQRD